MGSQRDLLKEALRERSPLRNALNARGLTLLDIVGGVGTTAAKAYEQDIKGYLDTNWSASLEDLIGLKMDPVKVLQKEFGEIMSLIGEPRQKKLSDDLQGEIDKLDRQLVIQRMVKAGKIVRHKDRYLHGDEITGSWKTVGAKIIEDLGIDPLKKGAVDAFVTAIHKSELKVKKVGSGEVHGYLEYRNKRAETMNVRYKQGHFKAGQGRVFRGRQWNLLALIKINAPKGLEKMKRKQLGIPPRSRSWRKWLY